MWLCFLGAKAFVTGGETDWARKGVLFCFLSSVFAWAAGKLLWPENEFKDDVSEKAEARIRNVNSFVAAEWLPKVRVTRRKYEHHSEAKRGEVHV